MLFCLLTKGRGDNSLQQGWREGNRLPKERPFCFNRSVNHGPILLAALLLAPAAQAQDYYAPAQGKTGSELRQALHLLIRNHLVVPYSSSGPDTSDALKVLDEDPANT